jgi:HK97 family phage major capsid protein
MRLQELQKELDEKRGELRALFEDHRTSDGEYDLTAEQCAEVRKRNDELTEVGKKYDAAKAEYAEAERIAREVEQKAQPHRLPFSDGGQPGSSQQSAVSSQKGERGEQLDLGALFVKSAAFRQYRGGRSPVVELDVDLKTLFQTTAGWAPETSRTGRVELYPTQQPVVSDIIPQTRTQQAAVVYMEETTFTNNAAETSEGGTYPEGALALTERTSDVRKIAVFLPVTDELFEDETRARDYVNNRLMFFLRQRLDQQILVGNGTPPNLRGVLNLASIQTQAKGTDPVPDAIFKGMVKVRSIGFTEPSHIVLHPNDWQDIRLLRTADGVYIWGNPSEAGPERMWGKPVVQSTYETEGTGVVGDFAMFSELAVRRGVEVQVTNSHGTYFIEGKLAIRADLRCALIYYRQTAFCKITGI